MAIEITPIREEHIEGFHAAVDVVARERRYLSFLEAPPIEQARAFVHRNIAEGYPQLVAVDDGRVVGWCDALSRDRPVLQHCGTLGMGLLPHWRGKGLGERLLSETLDAARAFGLSRIELEVRHDNTRAAALYRKLGFKMEGRKRCAVLVDGIFHDLIMMALLLEGVGGRIQRV